MDLKRGSVLGGLLCGLVLLANTEAQAQGQGVPGRVAALEAQLDQALASIAQLKADLASEASARKAADEALEASIGAAGGVTQAVLDAAIAGEAGERAAADAELDGRIDSEAAARAAFDATMAPLLSLAPLGTYVSVSTGNLNGLAGPHVIFSGANVHIRSGHASRDSFTENGRGNLIVGYNEPSGAADHERGGSHNLVVGPNHRYNFGVGFVFGHASRLGGDGASVSGGMANTAGGEFSTVSAGSNNMASGAFSSVSGGDSNIASGNTAAISAGQMNQATGDLSSVSGGFNNNASGVFSTVGGGSNLVNAIGFTFVP